MVIGILQKKGLFDHESIFLASEIESSAIDLDRLNSKPFHKNLLFIYFCSKSDTLDQSLALTET
jgi:hypothetical protein